MDATYQPSALSPTGPVTGARRPRITCLAPDYGVAEDVASTLRRLLPDASVEATSIAMVTHADAPDCLIVLPGADAGEGIDAICRFRAQGGEGAILLVVDDPAAVEAVSVAMLGIDEVLAARSIGTDVLAALHRVFAAQSRAGHEAAALTRYLAHCHTLLAAGRSVTRLPHRLNNPLAALLAEAELLRLEPLSSDQRDAVDRILAISHRLIAEVRHLEGMSGDSI